ncbi:TPA: FRG domain-containing protein [Stenotrophomonas maltophilia]|uniref:FRG domain-containing protein n=1 Tax=Stenotrophomonas TaxID=40323 RepID=UPI0013116755|nr:MULTISPECIES: FRG domain-containing protein [Stenotrophomonas]EKU9959338.1 FRG domain-containing protein [Stenotrophomonas maltophilia]EKU9974439.1 FRG domain-containing protein [Stenotrophomonas maltophilia]EKU9983911.1 FRG domain-containing protein [Stenotrophomonas maltophilia]MBD3739144.1 FRG domain-containing protein [Stenotrophomonas sp.]MBH1731662.1 FRG domain-containing protein [Stenotrophomonas maltophilia]
MKEGNSGVAKGPTLIKVESVSAYVEQVRAIVQNEDGPVWMRGQSQAAHRLLPSVLRETIPLIGPRGQALVGNETFQASGVIDTGPNPERMLEDFKRRALPFITSVPRNDFEWLFLMQHHGVPTRLLDWTTNALVALYFAVDGVRSAAPSQSVSSDPDDSVQEFDRNSAAVFLMNPERINAELHVDVTTPVDVAQDYETWHPYTRPMSSASEMSTYAPLCILAPQISPRIRAQAGLFSLHGSNLEPLDYYTVTRPLITKILIPNDAAIRIRQELHILGITPSFVFPDLDGVAREVKENELRAFGQERRVYLASLSERAS